MILKSVPPKQSRNATKRDQALEIGINLFKPVYLERTFVPHLQDQKSVLRINDLAHSKNQASLQIPSKQFSPILLPKSCQNSQKRKKSQQQTRYQKTHNQESDCSPSRQIKSFWALDTKIQASSRRLNSPIFHRRSLNKISRLQRPVKIEEYKSVSFPLNAEGSRRRPQIEGGEVSNEHISVMQVRQKEPYSPVSWIKNTPLICGSLSANNFAQTFQGLDNTPVAAEKVFAVSVKNRTADQNVVEFLKSRTTLKRNLKIETHVPAEEKQIYTDTKNNMDFLMRLQIPTMPSFSTNLINVKKYQKNKDGNQCSTPIRKYSKEVDVSTPMTSIRCRNQTELAETKQMRMSPNNPKRADITFATPQNQVWLKRIISTSTPVNEKQQEDVCNFLFVEGGIISLKVLSFLKQDPTYKFMVLKKLYESVGSTVFLCLHITTRTIYCLKRLAGCSKKRETAQWSRTKEFCIQARTSHPNIVSSYCMLYDSQYVYLMMEYMEAGSLEQIRKKEEKQKFFPIKCLEPHATKLQKIHARLYQILKAVEYLHERNIIHHDIKPENVLCTFNTYKLGDYGCSTYTNEIRHAGTLDYAAPELLLHEEYNQSIDMWAIGCLAFELSVGVPPFFTEDRERTIQMIKNVHFNPKLVKNPQIQELISKLLKKNKNQRPTAQNILQGKFFSKLQSS